MEPLVHVAVTNSGPNTLLPWCRKLLEHELFEDCGFQLDGSWRNWYYSPLSAREFAYFKEQLSSFGDGKRIFLAKK